MQRCLQLAALGLGKTAPNPLVGAVVVWKDQIIGEGYHHAAGQPHAEVEAIRSVDDKSKLSESCIYVNLEPCNHTGKTPPCTELILEHKIPKIIVGQTDPNPEVSGSGIRRLRENKLEVIEGVLQKEALDLNKRFNIFHTKKRPFILLKWAETKDGFIDVFREPGQAANPAWITDEYCRMLVHKWRTEEPSILVGTRTAILDNPKLNIRAWSGKNPLRLVLDRSGKLPSDLNLFDQSQDTWVFSDQKKDSKKNLKYYQIPSETDDLEYLLNTLYKENIQSIMVEGGSELLSSFIQNGLWDEARVFVGPGSFGKGVAAPQFSHPRRSQSSVGNSTLSIYRNF